MELEVFGAFYFGWFGDLYAFGYLSIIRRVFARLHRTHALVVAVFGIGRYVFGVQVGSGRTYRTS